MVKQRNIALCVIFSIITFGIYGIYWFICLTNDAHELAPEEATASGGMAILFTIITCGIYSIYWVYKQGKKIDAAKGGDGNTAILYLILDIIGLSIIATILMQNEINKLAA